MKSLHVLQAFFCLHAKQSLLAFLKGNKK
jgi:hypothetical protein